MPNSASDVAVFGNIITTNRTVTLDGAFTVRGLIFDDDNNYTISSTVNTLTLATLGGNATITVKNDSGNGAHTISSRLAFNAPVDLSTISAGDFTLSGAISGAGNLNKLGSGVLVLSADNSGWGSGMVINAGVVRASYAPPTADSGAYRGLGSGAIFVASGATLDLDRAARTGSFTGYVANDLQLSGSGLGGTGALRQARAEGTVLRGNISLAGGATISSTGTPSGSLFAIMLGDPTTGQGSLSGTGPLTFSADAAATAQRAPIQLNVRSAHGGGTIINANALLDISLSGSLVGTGETTINSQGQLRVRRVAGSDASISSVSANSIALAGGTLSVTGDFDFATMLSPSSSGGILALHGVSQYAAGGINSIDFSIMPSGSAIRLGATLASSIAGSVSITPEATTRTLRFGGAASDLTVNAPINDTAGGATHIDLQSAGKLILPIANSFTGTTTIRQATLVANHSSSLGGASGADSDGTELQAAASLVVGPGVTIANERIRMNGVGAAMTVDTTSSVNGSVVMQSDASITGGDINAAIEGSGRPTFGGILQVLRGASSFTSEAFIGSGRVEVRSPTGLGTTGAGTTVKSGAQLDLYATTSEPITVAQGGKIKFGAGAGIDHQGTIVVNPGGTAMSDAGAVLSGTLILQSNTATLDLTGTGTVSKTSANKLTLSSLGAGFSGTISVAQGTLLVNSGSFGNTTGATIIAATSGASIEGTIGGTADSLFLNNSIGNGVGSLTSSAGSATNGFIVTGAVDLGTIGSTVGARDRGILVLAGPISGGALSIQCESTLDSVRITGAANTYNGATRVAWGQLVLAGAGKLPATPQITLAKGILTCDNSASSVLDRVPDSAPLSLSFGALRLVGDSETFGATTAMRGDNDLILMNFGYGAGVMTLRSFSCEPGAFVQITSTTSAGDATSLFGNDPQAGKVMIATPPVVRNGMLTPGLWVGGSVNRFTTYGPNGIVPLYGSSSNINTAGVSDNVELSAAAVLSASKTINSLRLVPTSPLDLGGRTLVLDSGGILVGTETTSQNPLTISNGVIAPGAGSANELKINGSVNVSAQITDGAGGPTSVTLRGNAYLSGLNTYTGGTFVSGFAAADGSAMPVGGDVTIHQYFSLYSTNSTPVALGRVVLDGTTGAAFNGTAYVQAKSIDAEAGFIGVNLVGSFPLIKTGPGTLTVAGVQWDYSGVVELRGGVIRTNESSFQPLLGTGALTIGPGTQLVLTGNGSPGIDNPTTLNGGAIRSESSTGQFSQSVQVSGTASASRLAFNGSVVVEAAATLTSTLNRDIKFTGDLRVDGVVRTEGTSTVTVAPTSGHVVSGTGSIQGNVTIGSGASLSPGNSIGTLTVLGNVVVASGGIISIELGSGGLSDLLSIQGNLDLSTVNDGLVLTGGDAGQSYTFLSYTGSLTGVFNNISPGYVVNNDPFTHTLSVTPISVPEPSVYVFVGLGCLAALRRRHRRRSSSRDHGNAPNLYTEAPNCVSPLQPR